MPSWHVDDAAIDAHERSAMPKHLELKRQAISVQLVGYPPHPGFRGFGPEVEVNTCADLILILVSDCIAYRVVVTGLRLKIFARAPDRHLRVTRVGRSQDKRVFQRDQSSARAAA